MNIKQVIELVEKWIENPEAVSKEELGIAGIFARAAAAVHADADAADAWYGDAEAVEVWFAVYSALNGDIDDAKFWVAEYRKRLND